MTTATQTKTDGKAAGEAAAAKASDEKIVPIQPEDTEVEVSAPQSEAGAEAAAAASSGQADGKGDGREAKAAALNDRHAQQKSEREETRERAARRFREMRDAERAQSGKAVAGKPPAREEAEPAEGEPEPARAEPKDEPARREPARAAEKGKAPAPRVARVKLDGVWHDVPLEDVSVPLKVYDREEEAPLDDVVRRAQRSTAEQEKFDKAKRVIQNTIRAAHGQRPNGTAEDPPPARSEPEDPPAEPAASKPHKADPSPPRPEDPPRRSKLDRDRLRQVAEKIQVGDTDEGADALEELVEQAVEAVTTRQANPEEIRKVTRAELERDRLRAENDAALKRFGDKFPELAESTPKARRMASAAALTICDELVRDLVDTGAVTEEQIEPFRSDAGALAGLHHVARANGLKVRSRDEVLDAVGDTLVQDFGLRRAQPNPQREETPPPRREPQSDPALQERIERKRAAAQQPRTAGVRAPAPQSPRVRTREEWVRDLRRMRGFPVHS